MFTTLRVALLSFSTVIAMTVSPFLPEKQIVQQQSNKDELDLWIDQLELKELGPGYPIDYCKIDVDDVEVCGCLQYKKTTFINDSIKYNLYPDIEVQEIENHYKDCVEQKRLARITLQNEEFGWRRWYTSVIPRGLGLPPTQKTQ